MLIPIGLDEARLSRMPWVSAIILALNVLVFFGTSLSSAENVAEDRFREVVEYWRDHPYLDLPADMEERLGVTRERLSRMTGARIADSRPPGAGAAQSRLDALCSDLLAAVDEMPARRWALVPARGLRQPGWITHQFLHGGFGHLLGNMLVFVLVTAPFLEDVWGRPFFLAFYLTGGVVAGAAQSLPMGSSQTAILGASGAISACLGAFALRFAHRRVRMLYWFFLFLRGTFFVPAWAFAFFGLAMDLLGLKLFGTGGGVAYAAHVGGFLFGVAAAVTVRATGLEARIAPEGVARWGRTLAASRAADAVAAGRSSDARAHLEAALVRDPGDAESMLALARIHAASFDREAATALVERLVTSRLAARDAAGARAVLAELGGAVEPKAFRPGIAYRAAELVQDQAVADAFDAVAATGGGALAAKALLRSAERARASDPARARALALRARDTEGGPPELRERAEALAHACAPPVEAAPAPRGPASGAGRSAASALEAGIPVRVVHCRLLGASATGLDLVTDAGQRAVLPPERVAAVAAAIVSEHAIAGREVKNALLLDLLLLPRAGDRHRVVLRVPGHDMALRDIHPGVAPREAYARVVDALLAASGAPAAPSPEAVAGRPFARFGDPAAFEAAAWGRCLAA